MSGAATATQRDVNQFVGAVLTACRQDKTSLSVARGPERTKETGVHPYTTFQLFMSTLKKAMAKVKNLGGWNPTVAQRDEAVANYHVQ